MTTTAPETVPASLPLLFGNPVTVEGQATALDAAVGNYVATVVDSQLQLATLLDAVITSYATAANDTQLQGATALDAAVGNYAATANDALFA